MKIAFTKMTGAGNDFVVIDNRAQKLSLEKKAIVGLCNRRFGIGADGVLLVEPGQEGADFSMRYFNADGGEADMCGNGARCFARYARSLKGAALNLLSFHTPAGIIHARFEEDNVEVGLTNPTELQLARKLSLTSGESEVHQINTGVPHIVEFVPSLSQISVRSRGEELRHHPAFAPAGTNVNFVERRSKTLIAVRTYERGVEDETLACGTGITASALIAHLIYNMASPIQVLAQGGDELTIRFDQKDNTFTHVRLLGPATLVFSGEVDLDLLRKEAA